MITDINEDGKQELLVGTYDQTLFLFSFSSDEGSLYDAEVSRRRERGREGERERGERREGERERGREGERERGREGERERGREGERERGREGERERGREEAWEDRERGVSEFSCDCFRHNHVLHRL